MREVVVEARDVNEAIDTACSQLGVERDEIDFEIITLPKRGLFGLFGNTQAKVRVSVAGTGEKSKPQKTEFKISSAPKQQKPPERKDKDSIQKGESSDRDVARTPRPNQEPSRKSTSKKSQRDKSAAKQHRSAMQEKPAGEHAQRDAHKTIKADHVRQNQRVQREEIVAKSLDAEPAETNAVLDHSQLVFMDLSQANEREKRVADYVLAILQGLQISVEMKFARTPKGIVYQFCGEGIGVIIGRRGETLDALQYLASLVGNRGEKDYMRITLDSGNYREKREETLRRLAYRLSTNVQRSGRSVTLESMNPYERRIIHATVSNISGVTSSSIGEEPNRRVVISPVRSSSGKIGSFAGEHRGDRAPQKGYRSSKRSGGERRKNSVSGKSTERVTSTDVDKAYADLLQEPLPPVRRERIDTLEQKPAAPVREKARDEEDSLPLYGKIEI